MHQLDHPTRCYEPLSPLALARILLLYSSVEVVDDESRTFYNDSLSESLGVSLHILHRTEP
jgi:hypothetical protein